MSSTFESLPNANVSAHVTKEGLEQEREFAYIVTGIQKEILRRWYGDKADTEEGPWLSRHHDEMISILSEKIDKYDTLVAQSKKNVTADNLAGEYVKDREVLINYVESRLHKVEPEEKLFAQYHAAHDTKVERPEEEFAA